jgi:hypothetical protein
VGAERDQRGAEDGDRELDEDGGAEQGAEEALAGYRLPGRLGGAADVSDDEDVEDHHGAGVDDDLSGGDEGRAEQEEEHRQREEVDDQGEDAVEGVAHRDDADRAAEGAERRPEEEDRFHYSPSARSGVRSIGSASSISLVKIRSPRS